LTPAGVEISVQRLEITMNRLLVSSLAVAMIASSAIGDAADDVKSGLQLGERAGVFVVRDVTGPSKGKSLCYR
jgi:histidinol phosphatase-like enzyme